MISDYLLSPSLLAMKSLDITENGVNIIVNDRDTISLRRVTSTVRQLRLRQRRSNNVYPRIATVMTTRRQC